MCVHYIYNINNIYSHISYRYVILKLSNSWTIFLRMEDGSTAIHLCLFKENDLKG